MAHWSNNTIVLTTDASANDLLHFFEKEYIPAPLVVPWSGGDFFGVNRQPEKTKWKGRPSSSRVIEAIMLTIHRDLRFTDRLSNRHLPRWHDSGVVSKKVIEGNGAPERMAKASLLQMLRRPSVR